MAILDVTDVVVIEVDADTTIEAPDGNTYTATAGGRYGVPDANRKVGTMIVTETLPIKCMLRGTKNERDRQIVPVFTCDAVRTPA